MCLLGWSLGMGWCGGLGPSEPWDPPPGWQGAEQRGLRAALRTQ